MHTDYLKKKNVLKALNIFKNMQEVEVLFTLSTKTDVFFDNTNVLLSRQE